MNTLVEMFHTYLADLFPADVKFTDDGNNRLRIVYPVEEKTPGVRYSRSIVLSFEEEVPKEFQAALDASNVPRQDRIGDRLCDIVSGALSNYDPYGPRDSAFQIEIDSRALDL